MEGSSQQEEKKVVFTFWEELFISLVLLSPDVGLLSLLIPRQEANRHQNDRWDRNCLLTE